MSDDINKKLKQVAELLGQDSVPDNVKNLIALLASSGSKEETPQKTNDLPPAREEKVERHEPDENIEMILKMRGLMERIKSTHDPRVNLLTAIRPFLNDTRQKKVNNIIKILQMSSVAKFVDEFDK